MREEVRESLDALLTDAWGGLEGDGPFRALDGDGSTEFYATPFRSTTSAPIYSACSVRFCVLIM